MADFYLDENVHVRIADLLVARGHTALTVNQANRLQAPDDDQLLVATDLGRLLVTHDFKDYRLLCRLWRRLAQRWGVEGRDDAGVLVILQPDLVPYERSASEIHNLVRGPTVVWGEYFKFEQRWGWIAGP